MPIRTVIDSNRFVTGRGSELGHSEVRYIPERGRISAFVHLLDRKRAELFGEV